MDKYTQIDDMIVLVDQIFDLRGSQRAMQLGELIQRLSALKATLKEADERGNG